MANKKYKLSDSDYWEASGVYDITEGKTQREINAAKVPTSRTVNGKALSSNITLSSEDIGDDSGAGGANVKASLAALKGSLNTIENLDLSSITMQSGYSLAGGANVARYNAGRKQLNIVSIKLLITGVYQLNSSGPNYQNYVCMLPANWRPLYNLQGVVIDMTSNNNFNIGNFQIGSNGALYISFPNNTVFDQTTINVLVNLTFIA